MDDGVIEIIVRSEENNSTILTKNLSEELFNKLSKKYSQALDNDGKGVGNARLLSISLCHFHHCTGHTSGVTACC
jgi:hypothetical protein